MTNKGSLFFPILLCLISASPKAQAIDEDTKNMLAAKFNADLSLAHECDRLHPNFLQAYSAQFTILEPSLVRAGVTREKMAQVEKMPDFKYTRDLQEFAAADLPKKYSRCLNLLIEIQQNAVKKNDLGCTVNIYSCVHERGLARL